MNSRIVKLAVLTIFGATILAAYATAPASAAAAADNHPDFAWSPPAKPQGTRLFVGNLSLDDNGGTTAQYNPKELAVEQSVPWK